MLENSQFMRTKRDVQGKVAIIAGEMTNDKALSVLRLWKQ